MPFPPIDAVHRERLLDRLETTFMHVVGALRAGMVLLDERGLLVTDIMDRGEAQSFYARVRVEWNPETRKPAGKAYFGADGSLIAQTMYFDREQYRRMKRAGELNREGYPIWLGRGESLITERGTTIVVIETGVGHSEVSRYSMGKVTIGPSGTYQYS
jgi:hypothetical protein